MKSKELLLCFWWGPAPCCSALQVFPLKEKGGSKALQHLRWFIWRSQSTTVWLHHLHVSLGDIPVFLLVPIRLWGLGLLLTSFSQLQSRHLGLSIISSCSVTNRQRQAPPGTHLPLQRRDGRNDPPETFTFPSYCRALADIYENSTRPFTKTENRLSLEPAEAKDTSMNSDLSFCRQTVERCESLRMASGALATQKSTSITKAMTPPYTCLSQK